MGCCLPGSSNPLITGNQGVLKGRDIVMLYHWQIEESGGENSLMIGPSPEGLGDR